MDMVKPVSKISVATVVGKIDPAKLPDTGDVMLMRIVGACTGCKTGNSTYGQWVAFTGEFQATKIETGEIYRAGKIFFPPVVTNLLHAQVSKAEGNPVEFAFDIGVHKFNSAIGYEFSVNSLIPIAETDPIKLMAERLTALAPPLPAPTKILAIENVKKEIEEIKPEEKQEEVKPDEKSEPAHEENVQQLHAASAPHEKIHSTKHVKK